MSDKEFHPRAILDLKGAELYRAMARANTLRERHHGDGFSLCWIVNAKSGNCGQDCAFCAQSSRSRAHIDTYPLLDVDEMVRAAFAAAKGGAHRFSIVTSGRRIGPGKELSSILEAITRIRGEAHLEMCASLGCVERDVLHRLKEAGLSRYHHNLETAPSMWKSICTTRPFEESRRVIREAREIGLEVCSGGIFGLGESLDQRIELLEEIRDLSVDSAALNFFTPISGTPLEGLRDLEPLDCLRVVTAARMMMPETDVRICGGREHNVGDLQALLPLAGASGMMIGGYLTTPGRPVEADLKMLTELGLRPVSRRECGVDGTAAKRKHG